VRIVIIGAGPAGLYCAYLLKRSRPDITIEIIEQNPPDATFGFGVVFSDQALGFLQADDPETHDAIVPHMERWSDITLRHRDETIRIDGIGFAAIGRLKLLQLLQDRLRSVGLEPTWNRRVDKLPELGDADLVIGADGLNSVVRASDPAAFGETIGTLDNRFAWFGASCEFETLTQTFRQNADGFFNAHHYRYAPGQSTFIVECHPATFRRAGFDNMNEAQTRAYCEALFAEELGGAELVSNRSVWRRFPKLRCDRWFHGNRVLVGDALHTAHFSIGSGTRLALEDVIALVKALETHDFDPAAALPAWQSAREPVLDKILTAAGASADWYEGFPSRMALEPYDFAYSYIQRSGRITPEKLAALAPDFATRLARNAHH
jgi:2-polyprenyl-6-methoxyphenol hydroxylase-like FAD-dependent oxidoreductase